MHTIQVLLWLKNGTIKMSHYHRAYLLVRCFPSSVHSVHWLSLGFYCQLCIPNAHQLLWKWGFTEPEESQNLKPELLLLLMALEVEIKALCWQRSYLIYRKARGSLKFKFIWNWNYILYSNCSAFFLEHWSYHDEFGELKWWKLSIW
jgi:hypothetical protein